VTTAQEATARLRVYDCTIEDRGEYLSVVREGRHIARLYMQTRGLVSELALRRLENRIAISLYNSP
jgi:hypothetical protein